MRVLLSVLAVIKMCMVKIGWEQIQVSKSCAELVTSVITFSQQLVYMKRPKNYVIAPHLHNAIKRGVLFTKEVLFIKIGKVRVDFYDDDKSYLENTVANKSDVVLLALECMGLKCPKRVRLLR